MTVLIRYCIKVTIRSSAGAPFLTKIILDVDVAFFPLFFSVLYLKVLAVKAQEHLCCFEDWRWLKV